MSVRNFVPELWSAQLLTSFRKNLVFGNVVNRNYEGEIQQAGDTVKITTPSAITVNDYSGSVSYQTPASTQQSLLIDQKKYWAFDIDDIDAAQANVSLMAAYMEEAGVALADEVDKNLAALYTAAGQSAINVTLASDDYYKKMVTAGQKLDEANVPRAGRWHVTSPAGYAAVLANSAFIHATAAGDNVLRTGEVGSIAGFTVFVSNNLVVSGGTTTNAMYGTSAAITFAEQLRETEAIRREASFADAARGLLLFGRKVVRPNALGVMALS